MTVVARDGSVGSIFAHNLDTTDMELCNVSLWTWCPESRMKDKTAVNPPASKTAPASLVQTSSRTLIHCSAKSLLVRDEMSPTTSLPHIALIVPSTATILLVHSAETSR